MERPINPFRRGAIPWQVMEMALQGEFDGLPGTSDLTRGEIAEILGTEDHYITNAILRIKKQTGYAVPHITRSPGPKKSAKKG